MSRQEWGSVLVLAVLASVSVYWALKANASEGSSPVVPIVAALATGGVGVIVVMLLYRWRSNR